MNFPLPPPNHFHLTPPNEGNLSNTRRKCSLQVNLHPLRRETYYTRRGKRERERETQARLMESCALHAARVGETPCARAGPTLGRGGEAGAGAGPVTSGARVAPAAQEQLVPREAASERAGVGCWWPDGPRCGSRRRRLAPLHHVRPAGALRARVA